MILGDGILWIKGRREDLLILIFAQIIFFLVEKHAMLRGEQHIKSIETLFLFSGNGLKPGILPSSVLLF